MKKQLIRLAGLHKTGPTTVQYMCGEKLQFLNELGYVYPDRLKIVGPLGRGAPINHSGLLRAMFKEDPLVVAWNRALESVAMDSRRKKKAHDRHGLPVSVSTHAANHHEVTLVQLSFDFYMIEAKPENLIGDKVYDNDELDASLKKQGVEMIAPHRSNRKLKTQDGRRLRRYERRWLVERYFAWLQWKRRVLIRWEYYSENFLGFVQLASITMLLKRI